MTGEASRLLEVVELPWCTADAAVLLGLHPQWAALALVWSPPEAGQAGRVAASADHTRLIGKGSVGAIVLALSLVKDKTLGTGQAMVGLLSIARGTRGVARLALTIHFRLIGEAGCQTFVVVRRFDIACVTAQAVLKV